MFTGFVYGFTNFKSFLPCSYPKYSSFLSFDDVDFESDPSQGFSSNVKDFLFAKAGLMEPTCLSVVIIFVTLMHTFEFVTELQALFRLVCCFSFTNS